MHNKEKSVVGQRFVRTLKNKVYKYITSISKNMYIDKLNDLDNEYNNSYDRTIKVKAIDVRISIHILTLKFKIKKKTLYLNLMIV